MHNKVHVRKTDHAGKAIKAQISIQVNKKQKFLTVPDNIMRSTEWMTTKDKLPASALSGDGDKFSDRHPCTREAALACSLCVRLPQKKLARSADRDRVP